MTAAAQSDAIAYVRLHFHAAKYRTGREKAVRAPSGRTYYFDGPRKDGSSPWVPIYPQHEEDLSMFETYDQFEVSTDQT